MTSHWTNKNAILRDLSVAQGREVPVEIVNPVAFNEKPPSLNFTEETEEEFFSGCVGSGDFDSGPDIQLIQQMLDLVREVNITDIEDKKTDNSKTIVEISKGNEPVSRGADERLESISNNCVKKKINTPKKKRNVAVASLIETYGDNMYTNEDSIEIQLPSTKLLKPDDFMPDLQDVSSTEHKSETVSKTIPMIQSPTSMFKKKSMDPKNLDNSSMFQKKGLSPTSKAVGNDVSLYEHKPGNFVPSSHAGERYKKYLEKSKMLELVNEDIWTRAERQMKEIDSKRKRESLNVNASPTSSSQDVPSLEAKGMDFVRLPQHRHLLTGDCTVCEVLCTHKK
ncbi:uncharacterized protein LOC113398902 [Vanessa tameamea]|uniref:Uncharacterized protein LOC113398902 n=1 Tax=Vanessa tameamea TaxID=334116 RepID=A0ABM4AKQ8_VANTA